MKTNYVGIDYSGPGSQVNRCVDGIRYGIIPSNDVCQDALEDVYSNGTDTDYEDFIQAIKDSLKSALEEYGLEHKADRAFDAISDDIDYQGTGDCQRMEYSENGLELRIDGSGDVWVLKSPFVTYAQFCSPCAPAKSFAKSLGIICAPQAGKSKLARLTTRTTI